MNICPFLLIFCKVIWLFCIFLRNNTNLLLESMSKVIKIKKGLDIKLQGAAEKILQQAPMPESFAIKPPDFTGLTPKLAVKLNDKVKAGTCLFFDKYIPEVKFSSPVSGEVIAINRGERRKLLEVVVKPDTTQEFESFKQADPKSLSKEEVKQTILDSGLWPFVKQRPYAIVANPSDEPKAIYVSGFDSAPLAPDFAFIATGQEKELQAGIDALNKLSSKEVYFNLKDEDRANNPLETITNVQVTKFGGPHPAGNVGVQINKIDPINKGDIVWTVNLQDVITIGRLFLEGKYNASKIVALAGPLVDKPLYYKTMYGAKIESIVNGTIKKDTSYRIISGNPLTGLKVSEQDYLGHYDSVISVLEEGFEPEFMGWGTPGFDKFSMSRAFFSWLSPKKEYNINTNTKGGERAFVVTGQYDQVMPMDILPVQLLKAIIVEDIDLMEQLGIYEVAEEDFALCEFVCTSKIEAQSIIRQGLDMIRKEFS